MVNAIRRVLLFLAIVGCIACAGLWFVSKPKAKEVDTNLYLIRTHTPDREKLESIKEAATNAGLEFEVNEVEKTRDKEIGLRLVLRPEDQDPDCLKSIENRLKDKGQPTRLILDDPGYGSYIQINGHFPKEAREKMEKKKKEVSAILFDVYEFEIETNYEKEAFMSNEITIRGIRGKEVVDKFKSEIEEFTEYPIEHEITGQVDVPGSEEGMETEEISDEEMRETPAEGSGDDAVSGETTESGMEKE